MFILGTEVQKYVGFSKIGRERFKSGIHFDNSKIKTPYHLGFLDFTYGLEQGISVESFKAFNGTKLLL